MRITTSYISAAILAAALAMPAAAMAQDKTATDKTTAAPAMAQQGESRQAKVEERISDLYASLKITKAQDAEWNKFAQVMLDNAQAMDMLTSKDMSSRETQSADQILKGYAEVSQQHAQNVQKLSTAFNELYAQLSPDQKKQADEMFRAKAEERDMKQGSAQPSGQMKQGG